MSKIIIIILCLPDGFPLAYCAFKSLTIDITASSLLLVVVDARAACFPNNDDRKIEYKNNILLLGCNSL